MFDRTFKFKFTLQHYRAADSKYSGGELKTRNGYRFNWRNTRFGINERYRNRAVLINETNIAANAISGSTCVGKMVEFN